MIASIIIFSACAFMTGFLLGEEHKRKIIAEELKRLRGVHYDATKPMDPYFTGMYNGIELARTVVGGIYTKIEFKDVERKV